MVAARLAAQALAVSRIGWASPWWHQSWLRKSLVAPEFPRCSLGRIVWARPASGEAFFAGMFRGRGLGLWQIWFLFPRGGFMVTIYGFSALFGRFLENEPLKICLVAAARWKLFLDAGPPGKFSGAGKVSPRPAAGAAMARLWSVSGGSGWEQLPVIRSSPCGSRRPPHDS